MTFRLPDGNDPLDIGIFWDYENIKIPKGLSATEVVHIALRDVVQRLRATFQAPAYGGVEQRLYYDPIKQPMELSTRSHLDSCGFSILDCPTRNQKETIGTHSCWVCACESWAELDFPTRNQSRPVRVVYRLAIAACMSLHGCRHACKHRCVIFV
jgi:hypothetical protein